MKLTVGWAAGAVGLDVLSEPVVAEAPQRRSKRS